MEQFVDDTGDGGFDGVALCGFEVWEFSVESIEFCAADFGPVFAESGDDGPGSAVVDFVDEILCLVVDDLFCAVDFGSAGLAIAFAGFFEGIEVVEEDIVVECGDVGVEVAWSGEIEDEDGVFS